MQKLIIRFFDFVFALAGLIFFSPFFIVISLFIRLDSRGGIFYTQNRVGKNNQEFRLIKFRTMRTGSDKEQLLTVGKKDSRITSFGFFLRTYKLDELPQLINVLKGEMSFVGPRPEVRNYVSLYTSQQLKILAVKPGITDLASIEYVDENERLGNSENPEKMYVDEIMPAKILLNMNYINNQTLKNYFLIILKTIGKIFS